MFDFFVHAERVQAVGREKLRMLTGFLEVLGGLGLLVGLKWPPALWLSSSGLSLVMLAGLGVRIKVGDSLVESLPAFVLMVLNAYILIESLTTRYNF